jgi:hypothetical protein
VSKNLGTTMALDDDTVLTAPPTLGAYLSAWDPDGERSRQVFDQAIGTYGTATLRAHLTTASEPASLDALRAAVDRLDGEGELSKRYVDEESIDTNTTAGNLLRSFAAEHCGLFDGLYPVAKDQAMRFCTTYAREREKVDGLRPRDPRADVPAEKSARCWARRSSRPTHRARRTGRRSSTASPAARARSPTAGPRGS